MKFIPIQCNHQPNILNIFQNENKYTLFQKKQRRSYSFPYTCLFFPFHPSNKQQDKQEKKARMASPTWTWFFTKRFSRSLLYHSPCFSNSPLPLIFFSHFRNPKIVMSPLLKSYLFSMINNFNLCY